MKVQVHHSAAMFTAQHNSDGWHVVDPHGGTWWPRYEAADEIAHADSPPQRAVEICETEPMRGEWRQ